MKKHIFLSFSLNSSSVSTMFGALSNELLNSNDVTIITDKCSDTKFLDKRIKVYEWPSKRPTKLKDFLFLLKLIKIHRPIMMISMFGSDNLFLLCGLIKRVKHRITWTHSLSSQRLSNNRYLINRKKLFYKMATKLIANSWATKDDLIKVYKIDNNKIKVIYNIVEKVDISNKRDLNTIAFAGRLHKTKGLEVLIKAIHLVTKKYPQIELKVLGGVLEGEIINDYLQLVSDLKIEKNVIFLGNKSKKDLLHVFSKALVVVVPSLYEAFGLVVIEAFSVKTPVIGSNTGGIKEIIRDSKDGFLVEPNNEIELAEKILNMLDNKQDFSKFSTNCHERFLENFELEIGVNNIRQYLNSLIEN